MVQKFQPRIDKIWTQKMYENKFKTLKSEEYSFSLFSVFPAFILYFFLYLTWPGIFSDCELSPPSPPQ